MRLQQCPSIGPRSLLLSLVVAASGCQAVDTEPLHLFGGASAPAPARETAPQNPNGPTFVVEIREEGKQPQLARVPLPDVFYVQQALERSNALRQFRRVKVEIYRQLPEGGVHRLDVAFDKTTHQIPPSSDYALHPNDRLVITEDRSTILDDMLESLGGPLGSVGR